MINCRSIMGNNDIPELKSEESVKDLMFRLSGIDISQCPFCKKGHLRNLSKIEKHTGPNFFERLNLTAIGDTSQLKTIDGRQDKRMRGQRRSIFALRWINDRKIRGNMTQNWPHGNKYYSDVVVAVLKKTKKCMLRVHCLKYNPHR